MSAWPEAIYIIQKLNNSIENIYNIDEDIQAIDNTNTRIDDLNVKILTGGETSDGTVIDSSVNNKYTQLINTLNIIESEDSTTPGSLANLQEQLDELNTSAVEEANNKINEFNANLASAKKEIIIVSATEPPTDTDQTFNKYSVWMKTEE